MRIFLFIFIFIFITFCGCNFDKKIEDEVLPVTATLKDVNCSWNISSELNQKAGIKKMGTVNLGFLLTNSNDNPVYIPIQNNRNSMYKSKIEIYLKGNKMTTEIEVPHLLYTAGISSVDIKIRNVNENNQYKDFEDMRNIISDLEFRYIKDETDSVYRKMKVGDMRFEIDKNLVIVYEDSVIAGGYN